MTVTVTVASKLPHGFRMRLQTKQVQKSVSGGVVQDFEVYVPDTTEEYVIRGFARRTGMVSRAQIVGSRFAPDGGTEGGYALTPNIPKDFAAKWAEQNKDWPPLKNGFVIINEKVDTLEGKAREKKDENSGFEPTNPAKIPKEFQRGKNSTVEAEHD